LASAEQFLRQRLVDVEEMGDQANTDRRRFDLAQLEDQGARLERPGTAAELAGAIG
jgi:hypothetical protein